MDIKEIPGKVTGFVNGVKAKLSLIEAVQNGVTALINAIKAFIEGIGKPK